MITPAYLKPGDAIAVVATARWVTKDELKPAKAILESWGMDVQFGKNLFKQDNYFAGNDAERLADLQEALNNKNIKAVLFARGGYGTSRLVDEIDWKKFVKDPKWLIGYSDITVLQNHIEKNFEIESLHAPMCMNLPKLNHAALGIFRETMMGHSLAYASGKQNAALEKLQRKGKAQGIFTGGNLSMLYASLGTPSEIDTKGKILFIEDIDEYLYHIDRMMTAMKRAGKFSEIEGLIVGGMTDMKDTDISFGKTAEEIILSFVQEYKFPVSFGFPAGHIPNNIPLIMGRLCEFEVAEKVQLTFSA